MKEGRVGGGRPCCTLGLLFIRLLEELLKASWKTTDPRARLWVYSKYTEKLQGLEGEKPVFIE